MDVLLAARIRRATRSGRTDQVLAASKEPKRRGTHHISEPINAVLLSGYIDRPQMYRALGEVADIAAAGVQSRKPVVVVDSYGGSADATDQLLDCILEDNQARESFEQAKVKIYTAHSATAEIALSLGRHRVMADSAALVLHLPVLTVTFDAYGEGSLLFRAGENSRSVERTLALMNRYGIGATVAIPKHWLSSPVGRGMLRGRNYWRTLSAGPRGRRRYRDPGSCCGTNR
ncbi:MAG: hypothetical protein LC114_21330 [Bryobacterales bacterium]|nr:hypothetical protein [Bryobacterales bacterium]